MRVTRMMMAGCLAVLAACGDSTGSGGTPGSVQVHDNAFNPASVQPASDGVVTWTWAGSGTHNVTFEDLAPGASNRSTGTFTRDFTAAAPGTYRYRCTNHSPTGNFTSGMVGSVAVP